jgi:hypothetical protein
LVNASVGSRAGRHFFYTEEERDTFMPGPQRSERQPVVIADEDDLLEKKETADLVIFTIYEEEPIHRIVQEIESLSLSPKVFRIDRAKLPDGGRERGHSIENARAHRQAARSERRRDTDL